MENAKVVCGDWNLAQEIGRGAYGVVYLVRNAAGECVALKESLKLALSLTKGLVVLQKHHLLHRDIKPSNVVYVGGCPVLSDPGLLIEEVRKIVRKIVRVHLTRWR